jgi:hypothetical protein
MELARGEHLLVVGLEHVDHIFDIGTRLRNRMLLGERFGIARLDVCHAPIENPLVKLPILFCVRVCAQLGGDVVVGFGLRNGFAELIFRQADRLEHDGETN